MNIRAAVLSADRLPSVEHVVSRARAYGHEIIFEDGFSFSRNPSNRNGQVGVSIDGKQTEIGYAVDPLWLLIDDEELPAELAEHGDVLVTLVASSPQCLAGAAIELVLADESQAIGWRANTLIAPDLLISEAEAALRSSGN